MSFAREDITTRVLVGRPDMDDPIVLDDEDAQEIYGVEPLNLTDLETLLDVEMTQIGNRLLVTRGHTTMPRIAGVTLNAATDPGVVDLLATADPRTPSRLPVPPRLGQRPPSVRPVHVLHRGPAHDRPGHVGGPPVPRRRHAVAGRRRPPGSGTRPRRPAPATGRNRRGRRTSHHERGTDMATIPGVSDGELIRTSWGDAVADELNNNTVKIAGSTMTGGLDGPYFSYTGAQPGNPQSLTRKDYVDSTTVSLTGDTMTGSLQAGGDPFTGNAGSLLSATGDIDSSVAAAGLYNMFLFKQLPNFTTGSVYIGFHGSTGAVGLGSITMSSGSSVAYNTSSDYRLKDDLGPIDNPVDNLMQLQPKHLRWKSDQSEFDGFIAHEVADVVPYAVTGEKDAMNGNNIAPQQLDSGQLIPLLTAALQEAHSQIAALTARLDALESAA